MDEGVESGRCTSMRYAGAQRDGRAYSERPFMNQVEFDNEYGSHYQEKKVTVKSVVRSATKKVIYPCTGLGPLWKTIVGFLPILRWLPKYNVKEMLMGDIIGGVTVGVMHVPQGIAYAVISGTPPVNGLYASCFPTLFYMLFGTSMQTSIGGLAVVALMNRKARDNIFEHIGQTPPSNGTTLPGEVTAAEVLTTVTLALGMIQFFCWILHLEFLTAYFSDQLVSGFSTAACVHILAAQVGHLFGVKLPSANGPGYLMQRTADFAIRIPDCNPVVCATSVLSLIFLILGKNVISPFLKRKFNLKIPIPYELILVAVSCIIFRYTPWSEKYNVRVVKNIPTGMVMPKWPLFYLLPQALTQAVGIAVISTAIHMAMSKVMAKQLNYEIDPPQELFALGMTSMLASLFSVYPTSAGFGRSFVNVACGVKTQLYAAISSSIVMVTFIFLGTALETLPMSVLAAIIVIAIKPMFKKYDELKKLWHVSKVDLAIWLVTFFTTVCIDVIEGLGISILFALFTLICRSQWPKWHHLIHRPESPEKEKPDCVQPDICVHRFDAPLMFINAERFRKSIAKTLKKWEKESFEDDESTENEIPLNRRRVFIIDLSLVSFTDYMGMDALKDISKDIQNKDIELFVCSAKTDLRKTLKNGGVLEVIDETSFFPSLEDALAVASERVEANCSEEESKTETNCTSKKTATESVDETKEK